MEIETYTGNNNNISLYPTNLPKHDKTLEAITLSDKDNIGTIDIKYALVLCLQQFDELDKQEETIHHNTDNNQETIV